MGDIVLTLPPQPWTMDPKVFADRLSVAYWEITSQLGPPHVEVVTRGPHKGESYSSVLNPLLNIIGDLYRAAEAQQPQGLSGTTLTIDDQAAPPQARGDAQDVGNGP